LSTDASSLDPALVEIFLEEAQGSLPDLGKMLRTWESAPADAQHGGLILRGLHTLKGSARMAGAMALGQAAHEMETLLEASVRGQRMAPELFGRSMPGTTASSRTWTRCRAAACCRWTMPMWSTV
jgi:chemosensory pili system protein ChpA (sensor histidine kinase/response regulator)